MLALFVCPSCSSVAKAGHHRELKAGTPKSRAAVKQVRDSICSTTEAEARSEQQAVTQVH